MKHAFIKASLALGFFTSLVSLAGHDYPERNHSRSRRGGREFLEYRVDQRITGRNRIHVTEMFSLDRAHRGRHLESIQLVGRDLNDRWEVSSTVDLVNEYGESFGRRTVRDYEGARFSPSHRHLGSPGTHYDLIVDGDVDVLKIVVVLADECDDRPDYPDHPLPPHPGRPTFAAEVQIESQYLSLLGRGRADLYYDCVAKVSDRRVGSIDDVRVDGQVFRNRPSYWTQGEACAFIALMSRPLGGRRDQRVEKVLSAYINEDTPVMIYDNQPGSSRDVYEDLDTLLPKIVPADGARSLQVWGGYTERPRYGRWSYSEVLSRVRGAIRP